MLQSCIFSFSLRASVFWALFLSFFYSENYAKAQEVEWLQRSEGNTLINAQRVISDAAGNIYAAGIYWRVLDFGNGFKTHNIGESDIYVAKYSSDGEVLWLRCFGSSGTESGIEIVFNTEGNLILAGVHEDDILFGKYTLNGAPQEYKTFLVSMDKNGTILSAQNYATQPDNFRERRTYHRLYVDTRGNVYLVTLFRGDAQLGDFTVSSGSGQALLLVKFDREQNIVWVQKIATDGGTPTCRGLVVDKNDNIYLAALSFTTYYIVNEERFNTQGMPGMLFKLDSTGSVSNAVPLSCKPTYLAYNRSADKVFLSGEVGSHSRFPNFSTDDWFDIEPEEGFRDNDVMVAGCTQDLMFTHVVRVFAPFSGTFGGDQVHALATKDNLVYICGVLQARADFQTEFLNEQGHRNMTFVARFDTLLNTQWARTLFHGNSSAGNHLSALTILDSASLVITGNFSDTLDLDGYHHTNIGQPDILVAKIADKTITDIPSNSLTITPSLVLSPNPATETCTIRMSPPADTDVTLHIFDKLGRELVRKDVSMYSQYPLSVRSLNAGLYFLQLRDNSGQPLQSAKLLKR